MSKSRLLAGCSSPPIEYVRPGWSSEDGALGATDQRNYEQPPPWQGFKIADQRRQTAAGKLPESLLSAANAASLFLETAFLPAPQQVNAFPARSHLFSVQLRLEQEGRVSAFEAPQICSRRRDSVLTIPTLVILYDL
jgi:hypothetical protein